VCLVSFGGNNFSINCRVSDPEEEPIPEKSTVSVEVKEEVVDPIHKVITPSSADVLKGRPSGYNRQAGKATVASAGTSSIVSEGTDQAPIVGLSREQLLQSVLYLLQVIYSPS